MRKSYGTGARENLRGMDPRAARRAEARGAKLRRVPHREKMPQRRNPTFSWWGAAEHLREQYTSVDLQHKITEWWSEDVSSGR
ncbi:MAG: hypothetical protein QXU75_06355 [Candidatus Methanomethylicaceae archaeon]